MCGCDSHSGEAEGPGAGAAGGTPAQVAPEVAEPEPAKPAVKLDGLLRFEVEGLQSAEQAAWLATLFSRQEILQVEKASFEEGILEIRYVTGRTDREKLIKLLETNGLSVRKASYLNPDPDRSG